VQRLAWAVAVVACGGGSVATMPSSERGARPVERWRDRVDALCHMLGADIDRGPALFEPLGATIGERYHDNAGYSGHVDQREWLVSAPTGWHRVGLAARSRTVTAAWVELDATPRELCAGLGIPLVGDSCVDQRPVHVVVARPWNNASQLLCGIRDRR
jgi:hypothetical protein